MTIKSKIIELANSCSKTLQEKIAGRMSEMQACRKNDYQKKVVIKTNNSQKPKLFSFASHKFDESVIIVDNLDAFCEEKEKILTA